MVRVCFITLPLTHAFPEPAQRPQSPPRNACREDRPPPHALPDRVQRASTPDFALDRQLAPRPNFKSNVSQDPNRAPRLSLRASIDLNRQKQRQNILVGVSGKLKQLQWESHIRSHPPGHILSIGAEKMSFGAREFVLAAKT